MSNDRKLLELAAKAAGINIEQGYGDPPENCLFYQDSAGDCHDWNPLIDDGDAFRLTVQLNLMVDTINKGYMSGCIVAAAADHCPQYQQINDDPYAATRRAIVRAAAEIGRGMP